MADTQTYVVETRYRATGLREQAAEAEKAAGAHKRLGDHAQHSEGILARMNAALLGYLGFHAIASQIESLIGKFISLSSEAEMLQIQLGGMFQAGGAPGLTGAENFEKSLDASTELIAKMRKDARELPGTFQDLMNIFQPMLATGLGTGRSINQIEAVASRFMAASASMHIPSAVAGHELESLLMGRANNIMPLWRSLKPIIVANADAIQGVNEKQREGLKDLEGVQKVWHELTVDQRINALMQATDALQPAIDKVGGSWETISSTFDDYRNNVLRMAGESPFAAMKTILGEINEFYEKNQAQVDAIAKSLGHDLAEGLKTAYGYAKEIFTFLAAHKDEVKMVAGFVATQVAGAGVNRLLGVGGGGGGLFASAGAGGVPGVGQMLGAGASGVITGRLINNFSDLDKRVQYGNDALNGLWGAVGTLPGPLGQTAQALGLMTKAAQAFAGWVDSSQKEAAEIHAAGMADDQMLMALRGKGGTSLDSMLNRAKTLRELGGAYEDFGPHAFGLDTEVESARKYNLQAGALAYQFAARANAINPGGDINEGAIKSLLVSQKTPRQALPGGSYDEGAWMVRNAAELYAQAKAFGAPESALDKTGKPEGPGHKGGDTYNITINQEVSTEDDADRVLVMTARGINAAFSRPVVSSHSVGLSLHGY